MHKVNNYNIEQNLNKKAILTVIIPIRATKSRDISKRISYCISDEKLPKEKIEFLVVDDGSTENEQQKHKNICDELNIKYIHIQSESSNICMSRARNIGAMYSISQYIMFMDVDLYPYNGFYNDLLNEIKISGLDKYSNDFLMFGAIYLAKDKGVNLFFDTEVELRKNLFLHKLFEDDKECIEKFSTGTSVNVYNRYDYLSHGGYDEDFEKWGYEDLEFNCRMIHSSKKFPIPKNHFLDYQSFQNIVQYKGWKSIYRLHGDITFHKGIVLFHVWHDVDDDSDYMQGRDKNKELFTKKQKAFFYEKKEPAPLPSLDKGSSLLFSKTNPFIYNRKTLPLLGQIHYLDEHTASVDFIIEYIHKNNISRVLLFNPYGTDKRIELYARLKKENIKVIISERGALRDPVFFDFNGFNAQSSSYDPIHWDKPITKKQEQFVIDYIEEEKNSDVSLEKQNNKIGKDQLKKELNIKVDEKILFIPLQRPSDTVIKYFCGSIKSYENFINLVQEVVNNIDVNWRVVIKKHPLEDKTSKVQNALYSSHNIKDLLDASDALLLINSGVGLLGMLWNKPVYYCGEVFYNDHRINKNITSSEQLLSYLKEDFQVNTTISYRFLHYLIEEFYSFGTFTTKEIPWKDSGRMTVTNAIDFYKIRNIIDTKINYYNQDKVRISHQSVLFDRYKNDLNGLYSKKNFGYYYKALNLNNSLYLKKMKKIPFLGKMLVRIKRKLINGN